MNARILLHRSRTALAAASAVAFLLAAMVQGGTAHAMLVAG